MLYPLKFQPIYKEMIWGGTRIPKLLNLPIYPTLKIGEKFAISGLANDISIVSEGALRGSSLIHLIDRYKDELIGEKVYKAVGNEFPLLIKFIDANDDLSIQVHPDDAFAKKKHNSFGKTEMWYVIDAEDKSELIDGFSKKTSSEEFETKYRNKQLMDLMRKHATNEGDAFFIPAGKVHSIGKGNLIAEIQQTSDITYRLYDFDRLDKKGNPRELHHPLAMDVINFSDNTSGKIDYQINQNGCVNLVQCDYFTTNILQFNEKLVKDYSQIDSFVILINVYGKCLIESAENVTFLNYMEAILIPACIDSIRIHTDKCAKLLEVYL